VSVGTMHLAKGIESSAVVVMARDDEVIPLQERIEAIGDQADLQEVYDTERRLLARIPRQGWGRGGGARSRLVHG
jgi:superfamily I DNA/RNA helicase